MRRLALCLFMAAMCLSLAVVDASEMEVESEEQWNTLLEHTAIAGNNSRRKDERWKRRHN
jgi:hypothetical protein